MQASGQVRAATLEAVVIRADGTREDLGVIAHSEFEPSAPTAAAGTATPQPAVRRLARTTKGDGMRYRVFSNEPVTIERDVETPAGVVSGQLKARVVQFTPVDEPDENSTIRLVYYPPAQADRFTVDSEFTLTFRAAGEG